MKEDKYMPCTTILVGKKASYDGSTMIARNDDGRFDTKKLVVVHNQPKKYVSKIAHLEDIIYRNAVIVKMIFVLMELIIAIMF